MENAIVMPDQVDQWKPADFSVEAVHELSGVRVTLGQRVHDVAELLCRRPR